MISFSKLSIGCCICACVTWYVLVNHIIIRRCLFSSFFLNTNMQFSYLLFFILKLYIYQAPTIGPIYRQVCLISSPLYTYAVHERAKFILISKCNECVTAKIPCHLLHTYYARLYILSRICVHFSFITIIFSTLGHLFN